MSHHGRRSPGIVNLDWVGKTIGRGLRIGMPARRHRRRAASGLGLRLDELEARTLLSASGVMGPMPAPAPAQETLNLQFQPGSVGALSQLMPLIAAEGATVQATTISGLYTVQGPAANIGPLAQVLSANPAVAYADPEQMVNDLTVPNDPVYVNGSQWQLNGPWGINAPAAWSVTTGSNSVIVADTDTGLNYNLPDIADNVWLNQPEIPSTVLPNLTDVNHDGFITFTDLNNSVNQGAGKIEDTNNDGIISGADVLASTAIGGWVNPNAPDTQDNDTADPNDFIGWNYVNNTNNPMDDQGHGTFTAGEIAEVGNNGVGGTGVDWTTQLMPVSFLDSTGNGSDTAAAEAIDYAVLHGAKVINASWGGTGTDPTIAAAIQYADENNVIIVAAAGNDGADDDTTFFSPASYSAQYPNVIAVAATSSSGQLASFSDYGTGTVQLAAPGVGVYSLTEGGNYGTDSGTSMSAPLVTGTIALVEAAHPSWSMSQVIDAVLDTVTPDYRLAGKVTTGGVLNAGAAVANTDGPDVVSATPSGSVNSSAGLSSVQLTFNEEINPATFTAAQVKITGPGGVIPSNQVTISAVSGSNDHEFTIAFPAQTAAGSYTLTVGPAIQDWYGNAMNQNRNGTNGETGDAFVETIRQTAPGSTDLLSVTGIPAVSTAGNVEDFTVTALSPNGGTDTGYLGTVAFTSTDPQAQLPRNYKFTAADAGSHTFAITFKTAGTLQSITATDTGNSKIIGDDENLSVQAGGAKSLAVTGFPTTDTAGTSQSFTVTAYDSFGNVATNYTGTVQFSSTDGQASLPASTALSPEDQGTATFTATLDTAGQQSITATDSSTSSVTGSETGITVQAAALSKFVVAGFPTNPTAGAAHNLSVSATDRYGNVITNYTGTVHFSSNDPHAVLPANYPFTTTDQGTHTFSVTLETVGTRNVNATDVNSSSITGSQTGLIVQPAAAHAFTLTGFPNPDSSGTAGSVTVTAYDAYGNVATGYTGTVAVTSSDPHAVLPSNYPFTATDAGQHTFSVTLVTSGAQSITATDTTTPSITGTASVTVSSNGTSTSAVFLKQDTTTQGSWIGTYGAQGEDVIGDTAALPSYATVTPSGELTHVWSASTTAPQALQNPGGSGRIEAAWYSTTSFTVNLDLTDGQAHDIELYALDLQSSPSRVEQIQISNAATGAVLDTETLSSFTNGVYLNWVVRGDLMITITHEAGANAVLSGIFIDPPMLTSSARFLQKDTTTEGSWIGTYGAQGYDVIDDTPSLPSYALLAANGATLHVWSANTTAPQALQNPGGSGRIEAAWYSATSFTVDLNLTDGKAHDLELYALDLQSSPSRVEQIQISDATTGTVLDTETLSSFTNGVYLNWMVQGDVVITITHQAGANAVLSGIFIDPPAATASATFLKTDTTTQGSWIGTYGTQGYDVIGDTPSLSPYATVSPSGELTHIWSASTTAPQALQNPGGSGRIEAAWYSTTSFTVNLDLIDGQAHDIELYMLDLQSSPSRVEQIQISDATTGTVLDTETLSSFTGGVYLDWKMQGDVVITITHEAGANAVLSGIFIDPATAPSAAMVRTSAAMAGNALGTHSLATGDPIGTLDFFNSDNQAIAPLNGAPSLAIANANTVIVTAGFKKTRSITVDEIA